MHRAMKFSQFVNESSTKTVDFIKKTNNEHIVQLANKIINEKIKQSSLQAMAFDVKDLLKGTVQEYVNVINGYAPNILQQINAGNGNATADLYLKYLTQTLNKKVGNIGSFVKSSIRGIYTRGELKKAINAQRSQINEIYDSLLITTLMYLHNPGKSNEANWYNTAFDSISDRKDAYVNNMIDSILNSIYK